MDLEVQGDNMDLTSKVIGQRIKQLRDEFKLTQKELKEKSKVSQASISRFEVGRGIPTIYVLEKITKGIGVKMYEFFLPLEIDNTITEPQPVVLPSIQDAPIRSTIKKEA